jgi:hypothetical protein
MGIAWATLSEQDITMNGNPGNPQACNAKAITNDKNNDVYSIYR